RDDAASALAAARGPEMARGGTQGLESVARPGDGPGGARAVPCSLMVPGTAATWKRASKTTGARPREPKNSTTRLSPRSAVRHGCVGPEGSPESEFAPTERLCPAGLWQGPRPPEIA